MMALLLLELEPHPGEIAATMIGTCVRGRSFLLDFSRPLKTERWFFIWNFRFGYPLALHVPVIHEHERTGSRAIAVERSDPYFGELQKLWRSRYPKAGRASDLSAAESTVAEDFALHFPRDAPPA